MQGFAVGSYIFPDVGGLYACLFNASGGLSADTTMFKTNLRFARSPSSSNTFKFIGVCLLPPLMGPILIKTEFPVGFSIMAGARSLEFIGERRRASN